MPCRWHIDECSQRWIAGWVDDDGPVDAIEIAVNGRRIAVFAPTAYRKDLEAAGIGDGRRSFSFAISKYLVEPTNTVTVSRGVQVLHSQTLQAPGSAGHLAPPKAGARAASAGNILFLQTADQQRYRRFLELTSRTVIEYCSRHGYSYQSFIGVCRGFHAWQATYNRIPLLQNIANSGFSGWVCYLDADAFIADLGFDLAAYLADKREIGFIAAADRPHEHGRPHWLVNAGTFLINLATETGRKIIRDWAEQFDAITDDQLKSEVEWSMTVNDQSLLQGILRDVSDAPESIITVRGEPNLINYDKGIFIRQILRTNGSVEERVDRIRQETDRVLGLSERQSPGGGTASAADALWSGRNLTDLANAYGSDKGTRYGSPPHKYTYLYDLILARYRGREIDLLELGLSPGGPEVGGPVERLANAPSVRMWLDYFPLARIFGFDISDFSHIRHPRFTFLRGDAASEADLERVAAAAPVYDIIIDDASHASHHQQICFRHLFPRLRAGGTYIIEDLHWQSPFFEENAAGLPKTADFMISYFENDEYIPNAVLSREFMDRVRRETWSFAWFPAFGGEASRPKLVVLTKGSGPAAAPPAQGSDG